VVVALGAPHGDLGDTAGMRRIPAPSRRRMWLLAPLAAAFLLLSACSLLDSVPLPGDGTATPEPGFTPVATGDGGQPLDDRPLVGTVEVWLTEYGLLAWQRRLVTPGRYYFSLQNYGNESRREPFSTTIPDVTVEVTTSNNIVQGFFILRGQMPTGPIRLYGDGLIGFNYLFTETKISDSDEPSEDIVSTTNQDDAVFAYGLGGGVMVPVYTKPAEKGKPIEVLIDGGLRYVLGGEAQYLKEGSIKRDGGQVTFDLIESKTEMLRLHIGVMVRF